MIQFIDKNNQYFNIQDSDILNIETEGSFLFITLNNPLNKNDLYFIQKNTKCYIDNLEHNYKYHIYGREISKYHNSLLYNLGIKLLN